MDTPTAIATAGSAQSRQQLDELAHWVAAQLETGETDAAWSVTVALEHRWHHGSTEPVVPPWPVIGRRFASAHRAALAALASSPRVATRSEAADLHVAR